MQVMYDLQQEFEDMDIGLLDGSDYIVHSGDNPPELAVNIIDDVKTILVKNRPDQTAGLGLHLSAFPQLRAGDRITVTGRVPRESPMGSWGVALVLEETKARRAEECQLAQYVSPRSLFALSHVLGSAELSSLIQVQTTRWGTTNPIMDLFIDSILISRDRRYETVEEDNRNIVYSLHGDKNLTPDAHIVTAETEYFEGRVGSNIIKASGNPEIGVFMHKGKKALHVRSRTKDWDAVDIEIPPLGLLKGNKYLLTVTGRIDGYVPENTIITLQGLPSYSWRNNQLTGTNREFTLTHTFNDSELSQWKAIRITTNSTGTNVQFFIYSIKIKRMGFL